MSEIKLLPCPFCGGDAAFGGSRLSSNSDWHHFVNCISCGAKMGVVLNLGFPTETDAAAAWNTRVPTGAPLLTAAATGGDTGEK